MYTSGDGRRWTRVEGAPAHPIALAFDEGGALVVSEPGRVLRRDRGGRWRALEERAHLLVPALVLHDGHLLGWVTGEGLRTVPSPGAAPSRPLPVPGPDDGIAALVSSRDGVVAAGPNFGVYATDDDGTTWRELRAPRPALAAADDGEGTLFVGTSKEVVRLGPDPAAVDLELSGPAAAMAHGRDELWVLAQGGTLSRSGDGGESWTTVARAR